MARRVRSNRRIKYVKPITDKQSGYAWFDSSVTLGTLFDSSLILTPPASGNSRLVRSGIRRSTLQRSITSVAKTQLSTQQLDITQTNETFVGYTRSSTQQLSGIQANATSVANTQSSTQQLDITQTNEAISSRFTLVRSGIRRSTLQRSITSVAKLNSVNQKITVLQSTAIAVEPPVIVDEKTIGTGRRKIQKVRHSYLNYADKKELEEKIYNLVLEEVLGFELTKPKTVKIAKEITQDIIKTNIVNTISLDKVFLQETARLQAWLILEDLKRRAEEEDELTLLELI